MLMSKKKQWGTEPEERKQVHVDFMRGRDWFFCDIMGHTKLRSKNIETLFKRFCEKISPIGKGRTVVIGHTRLLTAEHQERLTRIGTFKLYDSTRYNGNNRQPYHESKG